MVDDDDDSLLISAISSRWGTREKRQKKHLSKELLTPKKNEDSTSHEGKLSVSCDKSPPNSSRSSSLAGSSELDVWSPIQKHFEEDILKLLSNRTPSKLVEPRQINSLNIAETAGRSSKIRTKLVHQIKSDGALEVVARRASAESMTSSGFQQNMNLLNQPCELEMEPEPAKFPSSRSFPLFKQEDNTSPFTRKHDDDKEGQKDDSNISGHKRGLSIKGSCRRQWLRNQSKIDKTKRKAGGNNDGNKDKKVIQPSHINSKKRTRHGENTSPIQIHDDHDEAEENVEEVQPDTDVNEPCKKKSAKTTVEF